jgi:hypothetical protein
MHVQVLARVLREFSCGRSAASRAVFVRFALTAAETFSTAFFSRYLLPPCLDCCFDPVPTVRAAMPELFVAMKRCIRLPEDVEQLERLNSAVSSLLTDVDRDVSVAARSHHAAFKALPVLLSGLESLDSGSASGRYALGLGSNFLTLVPLIMYVMLPEHVEHLDQLNSAVSSLLMDFDCNVLAAARRHHTSRSCLCSCLASRASSLAVRLAGALSTTHHVGHTVTVEDGLPVQKILPVHFCVQEVQCVHGLCSIWTCWQAGLHLEALISLAVHGVQKKTINMHAGTANRRRRTRRTRRQRPPPQTTRQTILLACALP